MAEYHYDELSIALSFAVLSATIATSEAEVTVPISANTRKGVSFGNANNSQSPKSALKLSRQDDTNLPNLRKQISHESIPDEDIPEYTEEEIAFFNQMSRHLSAKVSFGDGLSIDKSIRFGEENCMVDFDESSGKQVTFYEAEQCRTANKTITSESKTATGSDNAAVEPVADVVQPPPSLTNDPPRLKTDATFLELEPRPIPGKLGPQESFMNRLAGKVKPADTEDDSTKKLPGKLNQQSSFVQRLSDTLDVPTPPLQSSERSNYDGTMSETTRSPPEAVADGVTDLAATSDGEDTAERTDSAVNTTVDNTPMTELQVPAPDGDIDTNVNNEVIVDTNCLAEPVENSQVVDTDQLSEANMTSPVDDAAGSANENNTNVE